MFKICQNGCKKGILKRGGGVLGDSELSENAFTSIKRQTAPKVKIYFFVLFFSKGVFCN